MKYYKDYNLEDFLHDEDFRLWATRQDVSTDDLWAEVAQLYPDKQMIMQQAGDLIATWMEHSQGISDAELEEQVQRILHTTQASEYIEKPVRRWQAWISVAAACLLTVGFGWYYAARQQPKTAAREYRSYVAKTTVPLREIINNDEETKVINLPDGSRVTLNPGDRISYSEEFIHDKKREVFLSGEAFFDVKKDAQHPFYVYANGLATRVLGTSFRVKATDTDVEVLVRTGRVSVLPISDIENPKDGNTELLLIPNQQATFSVKNNMISKSIIKIPLELAKPETLGNFVFDNAPVSEVFSALEKTYGIPIVYDAAVMEKCSLRVELGHEPYFTKLDIITTTLGATYRVSDGQVVVSSVGCK